MSDNYYLEFEEANYAPYEHIKTLRLQYSCLLQQVIKQYPNSKALDLGCGRGEWLDVLTGHGFSAHGIDIDRGMLSIAESKGFSCQLGDAIDVLKQLESKSIAVISAFHVIEHITNEQLNSLIQEAKRVLLDDGLLILETPNPENISVSTNSFYLDPTHISKIPHNLIMHCLKYHHFLQPVVFEINGSHYYHQDIDINLKDVIYGVSPDFCVIAYNGTSNDDKINSIIEFKSTIYGKSLEHLIGRFDLSINARFVRLEENGHSINSRFIRIEEKGHRDDKELEKINNYLSILKDKNEGLNNRLLALESRKGIFNKIIFKLFKKR